MAASKEDILLSIPNVKNKKCDGSLCLLSERIAWMPSGKSSLSISQYYTDIKAQKISPDTKDKVQLQIVLHSSGAHTFHFNNPEGREAQVRDRDAVKDLLLQMLNTFKKQMNNDLEEKNRMLQEDPHLFQLYKSLVVGGILSADEFWANRTSKPKVGEISKQEVGVSGRFLADASREIEASNGLQYTLTVDLIESIFKTYPAVERKYEELVPDRVSESQFWSEFFKSHYFHLDKTDVNSKDLFAGCMEEDERRLKKEQVLTVKGKKRKIRNLSDLMPDESCANDEELPRKESCLSANASLVKRLNHFSTMVLNSIDHPSKTDNSLKTDITEKIETKGVKRKENDLFNDDDEALGRPLKLTKTDAYMHGPMPLTAYTYNTTNELMEAARVFAHDVMAWKPASAHQLPFNSDAALNVIRDFSPSGSLMQDPSAQQSSADSIPKDLLPEFKSMFCGLTELLRHFWGCFPITCKELEEKATRMEECLRKFQKNKVHAFSEKMAQHRRTVDPCQHINSILDKAFTRFSSWNVKRSAKRI